MTITTPSGHEVEMNDCLNFGQKRKLMNMIYSKMRITPSASDKTAPSFSDFSMDFIQDLQDEAFKMMIVSITIKGSAEPITHKEDLYDVVMQWPEKDGQAVFDELDKITNVLGDQTAKNQEGEKKEA